MVLGRDERPQLLAGVAGNGAEGAVVRAVVQHDAGCGAIVDRKRARVRHVAVHGRPHIGVRQARVVVPDVHASREVDDAVTLDGTEGADRRRADVRGVEGMHRRRRDVARRPRCCCGRCRSCGAQEIRVVVARLPSRTTCAAAPFSTCGHRAVREQARGRGRAACRCAIRRSKRSSSTRCRSEARSSCRRPSCPWSRSCWRTAG